MNASSPPTATSAGLFEVDGDSFEVPLHPPSPLPTPPHVSRSHVTHAPASTSLYLSETAPKRPLGVVSIHSSSLPGKLQGAAGPWYSCVITPDEKLKRLDDADKVHLSVLEFLADLDQMSKPYSETEQPLSQSNVWL